MSEEKRKSGFLEELTVKKFLVYLGLTGALEAMFSRILPDTLSKFSPTQHLLNKEPKIVPLNDAIKALQEQSGGGQKPSFWKRTSEDFTRGVMDGFILFTVVYSVGEGIRLLSNLFSKKEDAPQKVIFSKEDVRNDEFEGVAIGCRDDWSAKLSTEKQGADQHPVRLR